VVAEELPLPEGVKPFTGPGISLKVGIPCIVNLNMEGRRGRFKAQVKYIGFMADVGSFLINFEITVQVLR
jgi:hypothetical protein